MLHNTLLIDIFILFVLLVLSGFFSASETAFISIRKPRIKKLASKGDSRAETILRLLEMPNRVISTILVGNNIVNISASAIATSIAIKYFGSTGIGIATGIVTFYVLLFGEIIPKSYAAYNAERYCLLAAKPVSALVTLLYPLVLFLTFISKRIVRLFGGEVTFSPYATEEDLKLMLEFSEEEGFIETGEREMISSVFEFGETTVREIMVPRVDMKCLSIDASYEDARKLILKTGHSRIPMYEENIDNIVGILYAKDLLKYMNGRRRVRLVDILRDPIFVPENKKLDDLLKEFQMKKIQIAIVVDEYGGTAGMVTIEDILEELVGEIMDEYDREEIPINKINDREAIVDARINIKDVNEALGLNLDYSEFDTVGGLVFNTIGEIPGVGDEIKINGVTIRVEKMRGRRILKVRIVKDIKE
ncbi:MAG TPA: HlyC/CorC family transporter [Euryarchaeota archaeon]|nr:HlyC/CorC family transporter [Euryarchaeota archaeon]